MYELKGGSSVLLTAPLNMCLYRHQVHHQLTSSFKMVYNSQNKSGNKFLALNGKLRMLLWPLSVRVRVLHLSTLVSVLDMLLYLLGEFATDCFSFSNITAA